MRGSRQGGSLMTARRFKAMAHRSQGWWALEVTGDGLSYPAYTQARRLDQAEGVVRDLLALHFATSEDAVAYRDRARAGRRAGRGSKPDPARSRAGRKAPVRRLRPDPANGSAPQGTGHGPARHQHLARHLASSRKPATRELKTR